MEAESELVAGFFVEYSSTPFLLFFLGEYPLIVLMCAMCSILFLGGWLPPLDIWPLTAVPGIVWFLLKVCFFFFMFAMVKAMVPRYRYDQLMRLGWKVFLPDVAIVGGADGELGCSSSARICEGSMSFDRTARQIFFWEFIKSFGLSMRYFFAPKATLNYPFEKGPVVASLPRRACPAPLCQWRGTLHRLQAVRGDLSGPGHHH